MTSATLTIRTDDEAALKKVADFESSIAIELEGVLRDFGLACRVLIEPTPEVFAVEASEN